MTPDLQRPIVPRSLPQRQRGITLVIGLIILLVMTMTGLAAVRAVTLEERIVANERDRALAFQAAEAAVRDAIEWLEIQAGPPTPSVNGNTGVWETGVITMARLFEPDFWDDTATLVSYPETAGLAPVAGVAEQPKFMIEQLAFVPDDNDPATIAARRGVFFYRITSRGIGGTVTARSLVQAFHRIRYF